MTTNDLLLLSPELAMAILAAVIITADLILKKKSPIPYIALIGLLIPFCMSAYLAHRGPDEGFMGILKVDNFSIFIKYLVLIATGLVILSSTRYAQSFKKLQGEYYTLILLSATGMMLLASATEFITIYVALELASLPLAALAAFARSSKSAESGIKFLLLSAISSAVILYGMVLIYGLTGTSSLTEIAHVIGSQESTGSLLQDAALPFATILIISGFAFKLSAVPFQMWVPDVYEGATTPITAFLSVASKAAGFAVIMRVLYSAFGLESVSTDWANLIAVLSAISMTVGNLIAIKQDNIKRLLAYSTIAQAGYIMIGLAAVATTSQGGNLSGPSGILFYLAGYIGTNLAAFSILIAVAFKTNSYAIGSFHGLYKRSPVMALCMTISMLSLVGIPPTVGFMSKVYIFGAAVETGFTWLAIIGVINSVVSAYYYLRIVKVMFLGEATDSETIRPNGALTIAMVSSGLATFIFGLYPSPIIHLAQQAAKDLIG